MSKKVTLFIVEDDPAFNKLLTAYFESKLKWNVYSFANGEECLKNLHHRPDIWLQDYDLPGINGIDVMKEAKKQLPKAKFIFLSGQGEIKVAVSALKEGAFDYIIKDASAKENALNKVDQIMHIKKLEENRESSRLGLLILGILLMVSWIFFILIKLI
jgi:DNA-binding NtrC family response regulator